MVPRHVDGRHRFGTGGGYNIRNYPGSFTVPYPTCTYMCNPRGIRLFREQSGGWTRIYIPLIEFARMHSSISKATCMCTCRQYSMLYRSVMLWGCRRQLARSQGFPNRVQDFYWRCLVVSFQSVRKIVGHHVFATSGWLPYATPVAPFCNTVCTDQCKQALLTLG